MSARWGVIVAVALLVGGWSGRVVGAPTTPVAQSSGTSSSGSGGGSGTSGDSGSASPGEGSGGDGSGDGTATTAVPAVGGGDEAPAAPAPTPPVEAGRVAEAEETDCGAGTGDVACYRVEDPDGVEAVRVPDGQGGTLVVPVAAVPVVNVDTGASTSASSNVDLRVQVDRSTHTVVRVERRVDPVRQLALVTIAALVGLLVGAAVLGTFLRFRRGPVR